MLGDVAEFEDKIALKWTEGHIWVSERPVITRNNCFRYKYVMIDQLSNDRDDEKVFRIADLRDYTMSNLVMEDEWDSFKVRFTVFHPVIHSNQQLRISGNTDELGNWAGYPIIMEPSKEKEWLIDKYG